MARFTESVLAAIRRARLLRAGERVAVAVSGGADSVALLRALHELRPELGSVLAVAHFHHKLRVEADDDEAFVRDLAQSLNLEFLRGEGDTRAAMRARGLSLEEAARELRYEFFAELISTARLDAVAIAHTLDDQAETILMRIARGTGIRGLGGMRREVGLGSGRIIRPLLGIRRTAVEAYLRALGQSWRDDATNADLHHTRNRVRHVVLPTLARELNPNVSEALAELAEIAQAEDDFFAQQTHTTARPAEITAQPLALQRRAIRALAERNELSLTFEQVERVLALARADLRGRLELGEGWLAECTSGELRFYRAEPSQAGDYSYAFPVPGEVRLPELNLNLRACAASNSRPGELLRADLAGRELIIRNWRAGDRFHPAYSRSEKKLKELLTDKRISGEEKRLWPVAELAGEIVWVRGFNVHQRYAAAPDAPGIAITIAPADPQQ